MENQELNLEKVHRLIDALQSMANDGKVNGMLSSAEMLVGELRHIQSAMHTSAKKSASVCVVMPFAQTRVSTSGELVQETALTTDAHHDAPELAVAGDNGSDAIIQEATQSAPLSSSAPKEYFELQEEIPFPAHHNDVYTSEHPKERGQSARGPVSSSQTGSVSGRGIDQNEEDKRRHLAFIHDNFNAWSNYGISGEAPTLVQNRPLTKTKPTVTSEDVASDVNGAATKQSFKELNEQLRQPQQEWAQKMQSTPIDNLNSAIGVNDRYLYISELFRGDESMYERSIITLNKFNSFTEAHAWSERELRLKLGWDTQHPITRQFEKLIERRFMPR